MIDDRQVEAACNAAYESLDAAKPRSPLARMADFIAAEAKNIPLEDCHVRQLFLKIVKSELNDNPTSCRGDVEARIRKIASGQLGALAAALALGRVAGRTPAQFSDREVVMDLLRQLGYFTTFIGAKSVYSLFAGAGFDLLGRVKAYSDNRKRSPEQVREHAIHLACGEGIGLSESQVLVKRIGVQRLRTYTDELIKASAQNYLIRAAYSDEHLQEEVIAPLIGTLRKHIPAAWHADVEDAVQEAFVKSLEKYAYEENFFYWLFKKAANYLRRHRPLVRDSISEPPIPGHVSLAEYEAFYHRVSDRFKLVLTTFDKPVRVQEIWQAELDPRDSRSDDDFAEMFELSRNGVATTRRRLRLKMSALEFILDVASPERPDLPDDAAVLDYVKEKYKGIGAQELTTLRNLANLARAGRKDGELGLIWARFSRLLIDCNIGFPRARQSIEDDLVLRQEDPNRLSLRMEQARDQSVIGAAQLRRAYATARKAETSFLVSPAWFLHKLQGCDPDTAAGVLLASPTLATSITQICENLP